jgi:hypothetical protein
MAATGAGVDVELGQVNVLGLHSCPVYALFDAFEQQIGIAAFSRTAVEKKNVHSVSVSRGVKIRYRGIKS